MRPADPLGAFVDRVVVPALVERFLRERSLNVTSRRP